MLDRVAESNDRGLPTGPRSHTTRAVAPEQFPTEPRIRRGLSPPGFVPKALNTGPSVYASALPGYEQRRFRDARSLNPTHNFSVHRATQCNSHQCSAYFRSGLNLAFRLYAVAAPDDVRFRVEEHR